MEPRLLEELDSTDSTKLLESITHSAGREQDQLVLISSSVGRQKIGHHTDRDSELARLCGMGEVGHEELLWVG